MKTVKNFLWENAGAIFCYSIAAVITALLIVMDLVGIVNLSM